jgi:beta-glucanase (GH16 family)
MRRPIPCLIALAVACSAQAQTLVWSDEFDGTSLDPANWEYQRGDGSEVGLPSGWGNNEMQWYTDRPKNLYVSDGSLKITAYRDFPSPGWAYSSARIHSKGLQSFLYGRFEARIKLPAGQGIWPAFWMLPEFSTYGGWASSGEIDIMESTNATQFTSGTIHYGGYWPNNTSNGNDYSPPGFDKTQWHVYTVEWEPDQLRWYVDGQLFHTRDSWQWWSEESGGNQRAPFDIPFHLLLNVAVGGNYPGPPNGATGFPMTMEVDWVRVYQDVPAVQDPFDGAPAPIPGRIESERYDLGGFGVAYFDADTSNNGGAFRPDEGVDIQVSTGSGYNVGWTRPNEWIEYTVDVQQAGEYVVEVALASQSTGGLLRLEFDGVDKTGQIIAPVTGGWQTWQISTASVTLEAGEQILRFVNLGNESSAYNIDYIDFVPVPSCVGDVNGDGVTDVFDFGELAANFGAGPDATRAQGDVTGDGVVDVFDFGEIAGDFGCDGP